MPPFIIASVAPQMDSCKNEDNFPTYQPHTIEDRYPAPHLCLAARVLSYVMCWGDLITCCAGSWGEATTGSCGTAPTLCGSSHIAYICAVLPGSGSH